MLCKGEGTGSCLLGNMLPAMLIFLYCLYVRKKVWLDQRRHVEVGKFKKGIFTQFLASRSCLMRKPWPKVGPYLFVFTLIHMVYICLCVCVIWKVF